MKKTDEVTYIVRDKNANISYVASGRHRMSWSTYSDDDHVRTITITIDDDDNIAFDRSTEITSKVFDDIVKGY